MPDHPKEPIERTAPETDPFRAIDDHAVLFGYDGSEPARCAIVEAAHRLGPDRCAIVLTVEQSGNRPATELAYEGARLARSIGFDAQPAVMSGVPVWRGIVEAAEAHDARAVVLGTGSVAAEVMRRTDRPVLVVEASSLGVAA